MTQQKYTIKDVKEVSSERVYDGFFKVDKLCVQHKLFAGGWSEVVTREVFRRGHAVAMLPYDPIRDEIVLIEQFRVGALETSEQPWLLEIVAGMIGENEDPEGVCRRESIEEAGLEVGNLVKLTEYLPSPGGMTERLHLYIGAVDASKAEGVHGLDYEHEDILVHRVSRLKAFEMLKQGKFDNSAIIIAIQWFALYFDELREKLINE